MSTGLIAGGSLAGIIIAVLVVFENFGKTIDFSIPATAGGEPGFRVDVIWAFCAMAGASSPSRCSASGRSSIRPAIAVRSFTTNWSAGRTVGLAAFGDSPHVIALLLASSALIIGIDPDRAPGLLMISLASRGPSSRARGGPRPARRCGLP